MLIDANFLEFKPCSILLFQLYRQQQATYDVFPDLSVRKFTNFN